ncbi:hypothetical protein GJ496_011969 [Pomphorhynchus laevis]|nr:hypothetical protein GJ496_011969 [Pomphorhynchus laevis]
MSRPRVCWICFAQDDEDNLSDEWISPCRCSGTTKWTHQSCVQRWIDEKQGGVSSVQVYCPQCQEPYNIGFPPKGMMADACDMIEKLIGKSCPFVAGGILVGSAYWISVTYGAITVMQVLGHKEGLSLMEKADPLFLLIGLPTIPVMLIFSRFIKWQEMIVRFWRGNVHKLFGGNNEENAVGSRVIPEAILHEDVNISAVSVTRLVNGGLILPTMATLFGKVLFRRIDLNIQRTLLGGIAFISMKGLAKIYCRQREFDRKLHRKVMPYIESDHIQ